MSASASAADVPLPLDDADLEAGRVPAKASPPSAPVLLIVAGLTENGDGIICQPVEGHGASTAHARTGGTGGTSDQVRTFVLPIDQRLREAIGPASVPGPGIASSAAGAPGTAGGTAARGLEGNKQMTSHLRPKEIQDRIRAGASVEQVAAAAGCGVDRVEAFAYPVLLERASVAEKAQAAQPLRGAVMGTPAAANADRTLAELVAATLADRGQGPDCEWDAFRDERGWTVTATWAVGRTENRAEWAFAAQPSGATITPRNALAADLVTPSRATLRTVGESSHDRYADNYDAAFTATPVPLMSADPAQGGAPADRHASGSAAGSASGSAADRTAPWAVQSPAQPPASPTARSAAQPQPPTQPTAERDDADAPSTAAPKPRSGGRKGRPVMPSWEDVLLGTRAADQ